MYCIHNIKPYMYCIDNILYPKSLKLYMYCIDNIKDRCMYVYKLNCMFYICIV